MKSKNVFSILLSFTMTVLLLGLSSCEQEYYYYDYTPIFGSMADYRLPGSIRVTDDLPPPKSQGLGKITLTPDRHFAFVSEKNQGVRVADLSEPSKPRWAGFIVLPGNLDLVCYQSGGRTLLVADSHLDLVVLEVGLPTTSDSRLTVQELQRSERVFPQNPWQLEAPEERWPFFIGAFDEPERTDRLVVGFKKELMKGISRSRMWGGELVADSSAGAGRTGSLSRFALVDQMGTTIPGATYLYTLDWEQLRTYTLETKDSSNLGSLTFQSKTTVGWDLETIYPHGDYLYLGSSSATFIYSLSGEGSSESPRQISVFPHGTAQDPVVVGAVGPNGEERETAFITLRGPVPESERGRSRDVPPQFWGSNELIAVDVTEPEAPKELARITLENPRGLGLLNSTTLLVCDGPSGLRLVSLENLRNTALVSSSDRLRVTDFPTAYDTWDVITGQDIHLVTGSNFLVVYRFLEGAMQEIARLSM